MPGNLTLDQVRLLKRDNVPSAGSPGLADLGIAATSVEAIIPDLSRSLSRAGSYHRP